MQLVTRAAAACGATAQDWGASSGSTSKQNEIVMLTININVELKLVNGARGRVIGHVARDAAWDESRGITRIEGHHPIIQFFQIAEPYTLKEVLIQEEIAETNGAIHPTKRPAQAQMWITPIKVSVPLIELLC